MRNDSRDSKSPGRGVTRDEHYDLKIWLEEEWEERLSHPPGKRVLTL